MQSKFISIIWFKNKSSSLVEFVDDLWTCPAMCKEFLLKHPLQVSILQNSKWLYFYLYNSKFIYLINVCPSCWGLLSEYRRTKGRNLLKGDLKDQENGQNIYTCPTDFINNFLVPVTGYRAIKHNESNISSFILFMEY